MKTNQTINKRLQVSKEIENELRKPKKKQRTEVGRIFFLFLLKQN